MTVSLDDVTRVVAVRHGETAWNVSSRIQGHLDIDLNERGRWQAQQLAIALREELPAAIYSSDLLRARHTARAIGEICGVAVELDAGLRERSFGFFEGRSWAEVASLWPNEHARWRSRDPSFAPSGGESLNEFYARSVQACLRLARKHPGRSVVLVAHGGVMDCLYRAATRLGLSAPRTWGLENAAVNRLMLSTDGFSVVGWSDTLHLHGDFADDSV